MRELTSRSARIGKREDGGRTTGSATWVKANCSWAAAAAAAAAAASGLRVPISGVSVAISRQCEECRREERRQSVEQEHARELGLDHFASALEEVRADQLKLRPEWMVKGTRDTEPAPLSSRSRQPASLTAERRSAPRTSPAAIAYS